MGSIYIFLDFFFLLVDKYACIKKENYKKANGFLGQFVIFHGIKVGGRWS